MVFKMVKSVSRFVHDCPEGSSDQATQDEKSSTKKTAAIASNITSREKSWVNQTVLRPLTEPTNPEGETNDSLLSNEI